MYLFTYHAYQSWMPDRPRGFVRRDEGILPPDEELARQYRRNATHDPVQFLDNIQRILIDETLTACRHQSLRLHAAPTDPTHLHTLVKWRTEKEWMAARSAIKSSLTRRLNSDVLRRDKWFSRSASRKHIKDRKHFDYHMTTYLPKHNGVQWYEDRGWC